MYLKQTQSILCLFFNQRPSALNAPYEKSIYFGWLFLISTNALAVQSLEPEVCDPGSDVFTANGEKVDLKSLYGLHLILKAQQGICRIEIIEGLVWWRAGLVTAISPTDTSGWMPYKVVFGFLMSPRVNKKGEVIRGFYGRLSGKA
ncbi:hypothetical protein [Pseudomonas viridiflava]|uniref:hypothetical protein n=1 Tax=Pseudomonas viridiflava TaxID=33069 RepID=UPI002A6AE3F9|nr:hypothetical protein [Pseudomonas viridiflava]MDY0934783.1 hypothetical protein [Pseudomonas viridiflava]MDY1011574.1 hypothetical protein [Pseudomonas viridiflava]